SRSVRWPRCARSGHAPWNTPRALDNLPAPRPERPGPPQDENHLPRRNEIGEWDAAMVRLWAGWNETKARACQWMVLRVHSNRVRAPCRKKCAGGRPGDLPRPYSARIALALA